MGGNRSAGEGKFSCDKIIIIVSVLCAIVLSSSVNAPEPEKEAAIVIFRENKGKLQTDVRVLEPKKI